MEFKGSIEKQCRRYYRMEFLGAGLYNRLALQIQKKHPQLADRLRKIAKDEEKHGMMFGKFYEKNYGKNYSKGIWLMLGDLIARFIYPMPLAKKVKKFSDAEEDAVVKLDGIFSSGKLDGDPFLKCLKAIYADELDHSKVYSEYYS